MATRKTSVKTQRGPHKAVVDWFLGGLESREISRGDVLTIKQIVVKGSFSFASVRKALEELEQMGVVKNTRSVGARVLAERPVEGSRKAFFAVGVLAPPSSNIVQPVVAGIRSALVLAAATRSLPEPLIVVMWADRTNLLLEEDKAKLQQFFDGIISVPTAGMEEVRGVEEFVQGGRFPYIPIDGALMYGFPSLSSNARAQGRLAVSHLLQQLDSFRGRDSARFPPVYVFDDVSSSSSVETLEGCREVLLKEQRLFWNPASHHRYPGDIRSKSRSTASALGFQGWQPPDLRGAAAGRFFASQLAVDSQVFGEAHHAGEVGEFREPRCGVVCLSTAVAHGAIEAFEHYGKRVGQDILVVAVEQNEAKRGSFLTRVQPDYHALGSLAAHQLVNAAFPDKRQPLVSVEVKPVISVRRSTKGWLHKFWRSNPCPSTIRNLETKLVYVNPIFEQLTGRNASHLVGKSPCDVWGQETGKVIQAHDDHVKDTGTPHVSCGYLPYHNGQTQRFTFRFPIFGQGKLVFIGTLGFDFKSMTSDAAAAEPELANPMKELELSDDPADGIIASFFDSLPCSVLLREASHTVLYANSIFTQQLGQVEIVGRMSQSLADHFKAIPAPPGRGLVYEKDRLPGSAHTNQVIRFPLLDGFGQKVVDASIGFDPSVLVAVGRILSTIQRDGGYAEEVLALTRPESGRGFVAS